MTRTSQGVSSGFAKLWASRFRRCVGRLHGAVQLKPFQHTGAAFLASRTRALLADEPGVGKTSQFITAANLVGARRVGVVAPGIGLTHWRREFDKWNFQGDRADVISWDDAHEMRDTLAQAGGPLRLS